LIITYYYKQSPLW